MDKPREALQLLKHLSCLKNLCLHKRMRSTSSHLPLEEIDEKEYLKSAALGICKDALEMSNKASSNATIFKVIKDMADIFIIVGGIVIAISNFVGCGLPCMYGIIAAVSGILVSSIKTFSMIFYIETRGSTYKDVSGRLKNLSRKARALTINTNCTNASMRRKIEKLYGHLDEYDLTLYDPKTNPQDHVNSDSPDEESPTKNNEKNASVTVAIPPRISSQRGGRGSTTNITGVRELSHIKTLRIIEEGD